ncbi:MAG: TlpA family protein disulfide reductase [Chitinophaga sp.]
MSCSRTLAGIALLFLALAAASCKSTLVKIMSKQYDVHNGKSFPATKAESLDGGPLVLEDSTGTVRYAHIWSTTCVACIKGLPDMNKMTKDLEEYKDIEVFHLCMDKPENRERWKQLVSKHGILGKNYFIDTKDSLLTTFHINEEGFPYFLLIGKDGKVLGAEFSPDENERLATLYFLTRAREDHTAASSLNHLVRMMKRMKRHDDEETRAFEAFLAKYANKAGEYPAGK